MTQKFNVDMQNMYVCMHACMHVCVASRAVSRFWLRNLTATHLCGARSCSPQLYKTDFKLRPPSYSPSHFRSFIRNVYCACLEYIPSQAGG